MSGKSDNRRGVLKQLLSGHLTAESAARELQKAKGGPTPIIIVVQHPDGLYSIDDEHGLYEAQMKRKTEGAILVIVDSESAKLGSIIE